MFQSLEKIYVPMEHNFMVDLLSKFNEKKRTWYNHTVILKTLVAPIYRWVRPMLLKSPRPPTG